MLNGISVLVGLGLAILAAFPTSSNYKLNSYSVGPGGTNGSASGTYKTQGSVGEQANGSTSGTTYASKNGSIQTEQLNVPPAPTLDNGSSTYYNKLKFIISTDNNPSDTVYSVAVSTDNFVTTNYVQADGTLGSSRVYQQYTTWGGASGSFITGLAPSTTYKAKIDAKQGMFTNTAYGAAASLATVAPSLTFSVSPNSLTMSNLLPGSVITSSNISVAMTTNAVSGGSVYISGLNIGLKSGTNAHVIGAFTGDLASTSEGFGVQVGSATQTSGGPFGSISPYNGTGTTIGAEAAVPKQMLSTSSPIVSGSATVLFKAKASASTPAAADYQEVLTFVAAASF